MPSAAKSNKRVNLCICRQSKTERCFTVFFFFRFLFVVYLAQRKIKQITRSGVGSRGDGLVWHSFNATDPGHMAIEAFAKRYYIC